MNEPCIIRPNAGFVIPQRRFIDIGMPKAKATASGRYMLIKRDAWGVEIDRTPWFDNIILNSGLNRWGSNAIISGAAIGTGTSTPVASQTGLDTETHFTTTAGTGAALTALGSSPHNNTRTLVYRTTPGSLNGNYSEVGVGWLTGNMFSRALILDGGGSPTTISVTSVQQLDILYQLSVYPPLVDIGPTVVTISGVNYDVTGRALNVNSVDTFGAALSWAVGLSAIALGTSENQGRTYSNVMGAITATSPTGTSAAGGTATTDAYSSSSYTRTGYRTFALGEGNASGGIKSCVNGWGTTFAFQYQFDPVIPKDGTKTLVLNYSVTWARRP